MRRNQALSSLSDRMCYGFLSRQLHDVVRGSPMSQLKQSLAMQNMGDARVAVADPDYEANTGMFGGWTAALLLKAVLDDPHCEGSASALTVNFIARVLPGEHLLVRPSKLGASRSLSHWRVELHRSGGEELLASASVVLALRRPSESAMDWQAPAAPPPNELPASNPPARSAAEPKLVLSTGSPRSADRTFSHLPGFGKALEGTSTPSNSPIYPTSTHHACFTSARHLDRRPR